MSSPALEIPVCACGQNMDPLDVGDIFFCLNCDRGQEGAVTAQTREYDRMMAVREKQGNWYPNVPPRRKGDL